jgi:ABC-type nickel/cobalt efflux system permease component RcnA
MTPEGEFRRPPRLPLGTRIAVIAVLVALTAGGLAVGAFVVGVALTLIPVALIAVLVAYLAFRIELWRARRSVRGQRGLFRP